MYEYVYMCHSLKIVSHPKSFLWLCGKLIFTFDKSLPGFHDKLPRLLFKKTFQYEATIRMRHLLKWGYYLKKVSLLIDTYVYYILEYIGTYLNIWGGEAINRMGHLLERNNFSSFLRQLLVWGNYWCEAIYHENPVDD